MDPQQIKSFIDAMAASDLDEMEVSHDGWTLRLVRRASAASHAAPAAINATHAVLNAIEADPTAVIPAKAGIQGVRTAVRDALDSRLRGNDGIGSRGGETVEAPMFGVVHLQQAPGEPAYVRVGDVVEAGQLLCTIEAMKVFNEVHAERAGRVSAVLVASGTEVEAGQPLFTIERAANV